MAGNNDKVVKNKERTMEKLIAVVREIVGMAIRNWGKQGRTGRQTYQRN